MSLGKVSPSVHPELAEHQNVIEPRVARTLGTSSSAPSPQRY